MTNEENHKSTVAVGWYSKEDMVKVLHWNANLVLWNYFLVLAQWTMKKHLRLIMFFSPKKGMPNSLWLRYLWYFQQFLLTAEEEDCRSYQDLWAGSNAFDQDRKRDTIYKYIIYSSSSTHRIYCYHIFIFFPAGTANMVAKRNTMSPPARLVPWNKTDSKRMNERRSQRTSVA